MTPVPPAAGEPAPSLMPGRSEPRAERCTEWRGAARTFQPQVLGAARPLLPQLPQDAGRGGHLGGAVELGKQPADQRRGAAGAAAAWHLLVLLVFLFG